MGGEGNGTPLQYSWLENSMEGGAWWATVHGVANSWTQLSDFTFFLREEWESWLNTQYHSMVIFFKKIILKEGKKDFPLKKWFYSCELFIIHLWTLKSIDSIISQTWILIQYLLFLSNLNLKRYSIPLISVFLYCKL